MNTKDSKEIKQRLNTIDSKLDNLLESTVESRVRIDGMSGQIKLIWTIVTAAISSAAAYIFKQLN